MRFFFCTVIYVLCASQSMFFRLNITEVVERSGLSERIEEVTRGVRDVKGYLELLANVSRVSLIALYEQRQSDSRVLHKLEDLERLVTELKGTDENPRVLGDELDEKQVRAMRMQLVETKQELREALGRLRALEHTQDKDVLNGKKTALQSRMWADQASIGRMQSYDCYGPSAGNKTRNIVWDHLSQSQCGCLKDLESLRPNCAKQKRVPRQSLEQVYSKCDVIWIVLLGDSTMRSWKHALLDTLGLNGYDWKKWTSNESRKFNDIKMRVDTLRQLADETSRRYGYIRGYSDVDILLTKRGAPSILFSFRSQFGLSLSRWHASLSNLQNQFYSPHHAGVFSHSMVPVLDEPYFVETGSLLNDFIPQGCQLEGVNKIHPDVVVAGSALWDTFADSNMDHRVETDRCSMKIPNATVAKLLYKLRLPSLFNKVCDTLHGPSFVWRTSNLPGKHVRTSELHGYTNVNHKLQYPLTREFNEMSKTAAREAGITVFDFEALHQDFGYPGADRVHADIFVDYAALSQLFTPELLPDLCSRGANMSKHQQCMDVFKQIRETAKKKSQKLQATFWGADFSELKT
mmetsp:Transcript_25011/g.53972  ORF Transcript_25011/g.53972 Transcript_25011/m.53972 type:complete len:575 (-) Transcript_25011:3-1727(-)